MSAIRDVFARMPEVKDISLTYGIPNGYGLGSAACYRQQEDSTKTIIADKLATDEHFAGTYKIPMAAGAYFNAPGESAANDSLRLVMNETAAKAFGWTPQQAIGQKLRMLGAADVFTVSGVTRDFYFNAMGGPIRSQVFVHVSNQTKYRYFSFKLRPGNIGTTMGDLQKQWAMLMPGAPFEYTFMDESLQTVYKSELRLKKAATTATGLAFVIVLLGIIGLVSNSVRRRTKEIAIRKVIGASVPGIIRLFVQDYLPVLGIAGGVASPLAWWIMQRWLEGYATRVTITILPFVMAVGCLAVIMILLIAAQTVSAALANPVKAMRSE
jgi:putative ABC transport system permease protein